MDDVKKKIINLLSEIKREGIPEIIKYLEESTYFSDPASANFHNCLEGGLAKHSLNVYEIMSNYKKIYKELDNLEESIRIVSLLHGLGHVGAYHKTSKNVPLKGSDGKNKKNENGKLIFIEKESYEYVPESNLPYPLGMLSALLIKQKMKLSKLEDLAIVWHRGIYDISNNLWPTSDRAMKTHKLIMLLQFAIKEATLYG
jgi:23S rRNA maturation-related 3'-5' exoribonuclease YhaM